MLQSSPAEAAQEVHTGALPESDTRQRPEVEVVADESTPVPEVPYTTALLPVNRVSMEPSKNDVPSTSSAPSTKRASSPEAFVGVALSPIRT